MIFDKLFKRKSKSPTAEGETPEALASTEADVTDISGTDAASTDAADLPSLDDEDYDPLLDLPDFSPEDFDSSSDDSEGLRNMDGLDEVDMLPDFPVEAEPEAEEETGNEIDLDSQIEQLMKADLESSDDFEIRAVNGLVQDKAIYDGDVSQDDEGNLFSAFGKNTTVKTAVLMTAGGSKGASMPLYQVGIVAGLAILLILGMGYTAINGTQAVLAKRQDEARIAHFTPITQPMNISNNANFIFVSEYTELNGQSFTLNKISAGGSGTLFYFIEEFEPDDYNIILFDQDHTLYHRSHFDMMSGATEGTVLKFDAIKMSAIFLTLFIQEIETKESIAFYYRFENYPVVSAPVYLTRPILLFEDSGMDFTIDHAVFDNTSSQLFYSFNSDGGTGELQFGDYSDKPFMQATESIHALPPITRSPAEARFEEQNTVLGNLKLAPVRNLNGNLEVTFTDLYYRYEMYNREIDLVNLFARRPEEQIIRIGGNQFILEGMAIQGDNIVLVLHGKDENNTRLETRAEATLTVQTGSGSITLYGVSIANERGCDVLFNITEHKSELSGIPISQYRLNLQAVEYKVPRFTINLDISRTSTSPERRLETADSFIYNAFRSRLRYKSYEIELAEVFGFSEALMNDRALMRMYAPSGYEFQPMYAAHVVSSMVTEENVYFAIVEEEWVAGLSMEGKNDNVVYMRNTHQIVAVRNEEGRWEVISDKIL